MGSTNGPSRSRATGNAKTGGKTGTVKPNGSTRSPSRGKK